MYQDKLECLCGKEMDAPAEPEHEHPSRKLDREVQAYAMGTMEMQIKHQAKGYSLPLYTTKKKSVATTPDGRHHYTRNKK